MSDSAVDLLPALFPGAIASTNFHARPMWVVRETKSSHVLVETSLINQLMWMCWRICIKLRSCHVISALLRRLMRERIAKLNLYTC